jgi:cell division protein FtsL
MVNKIEMTKKIFVILSVVVVFLGCNMNPSKEARIQKLETEILQSVEKINQLEKRVRDLEDTNEQLKSRILEIENR